MVSLEPLLGPLRGLDLRGIDWVIVGGESGRRARPVDAAWIVEIRDQCLAARVPFFFKQWGGTNKKKAGRRPDVARATCVVIEMRPGPRGEGWSRLTATKTTPR